uniref:3-hydroxyacyl-CoA dehydrogenase n=1 Tax=Panagrolaimus sp. ES5 TaxID=591445 RepID=A0AC34FXP4_9BILA
MFTTPVRAFSTSSALNIAVKNVTVVGAGLMGSGIAQVSAAANLNVNLVDTNQQALEKAKKSIEQSVARVAKKKHADDQGVKKAKKSIEQSVARVARKKHADDQGAQKKLVDSVLSKVNITTNLKDAVKDSDLIVEAIVENIDVKRKLFAEIEDAASSKALLATNTSSLRLCDIGANLKHKERFGGLHFFNPVPVMKLLEVVRFDPTSDETFESLVQYGKSVGKVTVACKDTPGFIVNRLLVPYSFEAFRLAERGDASMKDIDTAMKLGAGYPMGPFELGAGYPMGPFELGDYVGLDTLKFIMDGWSKAHPNDPLFKPCESLNKLVSEGKLGRKSGEGFFKYN